MPSGCFLHDSPPAPDMHMPGDRPDLPPHQPALQGNPGSWEDALAGKLALPLAFRDDELRVGLLAECAMADNDNEPKTMAHPPLRGVGTRTEAAAPLPSLDSSPFKSTHSGSVP